MGAVDEKDWFISPEVMEDLGKRKMKYSYIYIYKYK
jgi:hypothetical protein